MQQDWNLFPPYLNAINSAQTIDAYLSALGRLSKETSYSSLIRPCVYEDSADSQKNSVYFSSADLGIGKEYLLDESKVEYIEYYQDFAKQLFELYGYSTSEAETKAKSVVMFEKELAQDTLSIEEQNSPEKTYNPVNIDELKALLSNADVTSMVDEFGIGSDKDVNQWIVTEKKQMQKINTYLKEENLGLLKDYSTLIMLFDQSCYLTTDFQNAKIDYDNKMQGITETKTRNQIASEMVQEDLEIAFAKIYVERFFSEESKDEVMKILDEVMNVYRQRIDRQEWMSQETKEKAKKKLDTMNKKIGYPNQWPTYMDNAKILSPEEGGTLMSNELELSKCIQQHALSKIGQPVDKEEWQMMPQVVNAYYEPSRNEIVFPAAILQPPFYDKNADRAANLGGIGVVIGHEITHAFDANGSQYDENGNYNVWWTDEEYQEFEKLQKKIVEYYGNYELFGGNKVNGTLTLTENTADLGGMSCVCEICVNDNEDPDKLFENYAHIWANKATEAMMLNLLSNNVHANGKIRVNAVASSMDLFYETYSIKEGDGMYVAPEDRVGIW